MTCSFAHLGHNRILNLQYDVFEGGQVSVTSATLGLGRLGLAEPDTSGRFAIEIRDSLGALLDLSAYDLTFGYTGPRFAGVDYSDIHYKKVHRALRVPISEDVTSTKIIALKDGVVTSQTCLVADESAPGPVKPMAADTTSPSITCPVAISVECAAAGGTPATDSIVAAFLGGAKANDSCDFSPSIAHNGPALFGVGTTPVTFTAKDANGNTSSSSSCKADVTVVDTISPSIQSLAASPSVLWPPNHKLVPVTVRVSTSDICSATTNCHITGVNSNEPATGLFIGDTAPDWLIKGNLTVDLRAERSDTGSGRVYTLTVECTDASGNSKTKDVTVTVPHDSR